MTRIPFVKAHACGNDFLILDEGHAHGRHAVLAHKLCSRNTSVGADGIEFLERKPNGELFLRLFNADGSEAELSGNGTRCVAAWLAASEGRHEVALGTHGGLRTCRLIRQDGSDYWIESNMGVPQVTPMSLEIPEVEGAIRGAAVNVGNPHFVLFPESDTFTTHNLTWQALGARIATDGAFPRGTNVEFVRLLTPSHIAFRIFERGCGPTTSSGTGTCAAAAAAMALRGSARRLSASTQGGTQQVAWPTDSSEMLLTGPAEIICTGEVDFA